MPEVRQGSNPHPGQTTQSDPGLLNQATDKPSSPNDASASASTSDVPLAYPVQTTGVQSADNVDNVPGTANSAGNETPARRPTTIRLHRSNEESSTVNGKAPALARHDSPGSGGGNNRRRSSMFAPFMPVNDPVPRQSLSYAQRPAAEVYYDSRAATRKEWKRRGRTLEEYYDDNPHLLPQLPFTWHHGKRRWRLWFFAFLVFVDASAVPIALYYGMKYAGGVQEYIIFAIVTSVWGGPTYLEFGLRTLRLMKKERFYRPLGTTSRWCADQLTWTSSLAIFVLTTLFIVGSAPHDTWLRVVAMAAPSLLWTLGGVLLAITLLHKYNIPAPFRISSTAKGEKVHPGVYYFIEDVVAVNAKAGRPFREALAARYRASPRFQQMLYEQSLFWSIPSLILAAILTVIAVIPQVPENWSYGVCWLAPFIWAFIWGIISIRWCKANMVRERLEWEAGDVPGKTASSSSPVASPVASPVNSPAPVTSPAPVDSPV